MEEKLIPIFQGLLAVNDFSMRDLLEQQKDLQNILDQINVALTSMINNEEDQQKDKKINDYIEKIILLKKKLVQINDRLQKIQQRVDKIENRFLKQKQKIEQQ